MYSIQRILFVFILLSFSCYIAKGQNDNLTQSDQKSFRKSEIFGFIRGGFFSGIDKEDANTPYVSSAFADLALKINSENASNFKAFADVRFRYGSEFMEPVNSINIREGYVKLYGKRWDITAGQQIVKWGKADFTNPVSKINPRNYIVRSPDREDMDMGNILADLKWHPSPFFSIGTVLIPYYRSSVLIIDPIPVPDYVTINEINTLITDKEMFSYGVNTDFHMRGIDLSISWFDGYDPMPGTELTSFSLDLSAPVPLPLTELTFRPYKIKLAGIGFESSIGNVGFRGEAAWSKPYLSFETNEYVPFPEVLWVAGCDYSLSPMRFIFEYSGKSILDYTPSVVDPVLGTEQNSTEFAQFFAEPGFDPEEYIRQQVGAFNRLYNYQLEHYYHTAGLKVESDFAFGMISPSLFTMYNFVSRDFLFIPEIRFKPSDGLSIIAGFEYYKGTDASLYDLVDNFMNSFYASIKIDF